MTEGQITIFGILGATIVLFLWGKWRHDLVALASLLACVLTGLVPGELAFAGFGHPAVITVVAVLVLSAGLQSTGAVDVLARRVLPSKAGPTAMIASLTGLGAVLSAFMNNVGAMALLMPIAIQIADRQGLAPGKILMPLSFGTILGGMTTLIGTPPNLIVSAFRAESEAGGFGMFDFSPVGLSVALSGIVFVALIGWRLVPGRERGGAESFDTGRYLTETRVAKGSKAEGRTLQEIEQALEESDAQIVGMGRGELRVTAPNFGRRLRADDLLVIEADPESLAAALTRVGLTLPEENDPAGSTGEERKEREQNGEPESSEVVLREVVVLPTSALIGRNASQLEMRRRYGINLLAISQGGQQTIRRLRSTPIRAGDVLLLLLQGSPESLIAFASEFGCVPLAQREVRLPKARKAVLAAVLMGLAVAGAAFGLIPAAIAFTTGVLFFLVLNVLPLRKVYEAVDWPVIVLLGALIPVAGAMATTGAADVLARFLLESIARGNAVVALAICLIVTMTLSDFMNNAATAAVMCPIAMGAAAGLEANPDTFLMAVAVGASCAFLTPIGHQNNTLILGPGGFRFGDYWKLGLPMELIVAGVGLPVLLWIWPL